MRYTLTVWNRDGARQYHYADGWRDVAFGAALFAIVNGATLAQVRDETTGTILRTEEPMNRASERAWARKGGV
jgi:hypothetical protein